MDWTVIGVNIALASLILATTRSIRADMRALAERQDKLSAQVDAKMDALAVRQDEKMDALAARLGRLEQEQARMNGVLETLRDGLSYRVERGDTGGRAAEPAESYEPQGD